MRKIFNCGLVLTAAVSAYAGQPPNIVVITTDDMGTQVGAYGDPQARTPYMDQLAKEGVLFKQAFATQSSCSPCRSSILSGLYPHQNGQIGLEQFGYSMDRGTPTLFTWLKAAGYRTGWFGKVHVGPGDEMEASWDFHPFGAPGTTKVKAMSEVAESFIRECGEQPFLLYYNLVDPHATFRDQIEGVPENPRGPGDVKPWPYIGIENSAKANQLVASYYNCVERADRGIGYLMEVLKKTGRDENTLVIFVSDGAEGFPRAKTHNYNAGVHIPFIVRWPGRLPPGQVRDELVSVIDIAPTVLQACGLNVPANLPGASLLPLCRGEKVSWRTQVFTEHTAHVPTQYFPRRTVFDGRYLLIWNLEAGRGRKNPAPSAEVSTRPILDLIVQKMEGTDLAKAMERTAAPPEFELIDLQNDPSELHNLAGNPEYASKVAEMKKQIESWMVQTGDPLQLPENLRLMSEWHDELIKAEEPKNSKKQPPYLQPDYVLPRYEALKLQLKENLKK